MMGATLIERNYNSVCISVGFGSELDVTRKRNPSRYTPSYNLSQSRLFPFYRLSFIFIWTSLIISYLANIWSEMRHAFCNTFDFRNMKPRYESVEETDGVIIPYSKTSEIECETQRIAEWGDAKSEPFVGLLPKPFSQQDRLENENYTFNSNMCDQIFDLLLRNNYIRILDHHVKPSIQGRMHCRLHHSFKHNFEDCNMF